MLDAVPSSATIVITTRNRKEELRRAVLSCLKQSIPCEILVIDDGSTDGTSDMVRREFPSVQLHRRDVALGLIVRRNEGARLASGEVIISIDDDAELSHSELVARTLQDFEHRYIAAVAIPFINIRQSPTVHQRPPDSERIWITNEYIGTAHAIRRDIFNKLGGYREFLVHQHEEGDFCIRLLEAGYFVRLGRAEPVIHHESLNRSTERMEVYGQRNLMLFAWYNVPVPTVLWHLPVTIVNGIRWGLKNHSSRYRCRGSVEGLRAILHERHKRAPVSRLTNRLFRRLKKCGAHAITLDDEFEHGSNKVLKV
jgi:glycosyltransferase involved in cell wall biosynthesis